jgi:hypothetical protein
VGSSQFLPLDHDHSLVHLFQWVFAQSKQTTKP